MYSYSQVAEAVLALMVASVEEGVVEVGLMAPKV